MPFCVIIPRLALQPRLLAPHSKMALCSRLMLIPVQNLQTPYVDMSELHAIRSAPLMHLSSQVYLPHVLLCWSGNPSWIRLHRQAMKKGWLFFLMQTTVFLWEEKTQGSFLVPWAATTVFYITVVFHIFAASYFYWQSAVCLDSPEISTTFG